MARTKSNELSKVQEAIKLNLTYCSWNKIEKIMY